MEKHPYGKAKDEDEAVELDEEEDFEHGEVALCGACRDENASDEFWIACDICSTWFHGTCVNITPAKAERIKRYICPVCSSKKERT